ncbi:MAG: tetratricopeptide repeat protein, partial [Chloroflexi bacterium]|nr:tetratricopeptide repeat protein [Chloroflexota bacterium]
MPDDAMFKEASDAIRKGELNRARNLFTRLLKSEPDNAQYWLWMSAVVETTKERVYCLREALRRDPQDPTIRGGLVLLGALSPQEAQVQPAPFIRRAYEIPLGNLEEPAPPAGVSRKRILFWSGGAAFFILLFIVGMLARRPPTPVTYLQAPGTPRPSATLLPTGTAVVRSPTPTFTGPTPLWMQLEATYTPTPFAINTPHPRSEAYRSGINAYEHGNWASMINFMQQVQANEPPSADIIYYIGEAYRFQCEFAAALEQYDHAIQVQPSFAPAYLGRARALLAEDPLADVSADLGQATTLDPSLGEIYLTQAESALNQDDGQAALDAHYRR